jgi:hypothetical protein
MPPSMSAPGAGARRAPPPGVATEPTRDQVELAQRAEALLVDQPPHRAEARHEAKVLGHHEDAPAPGGRRDHPVCFVERAGDRLLDEDVTARLKGGQDVVQVAVMRRADHRAAGVRMPQRLAVSAVRRHAAELSRVGARAGEIAAGEDDRYPERTGGGGVTARDPAAAEDDQRHDATL